jgi:hypothetical protein
MFSDADELSPDQKEEEVTNIFIKMSELQRKNIYPFQHGYTPLYDEKWGQSVIVEMKIDCDVPQPIQIEFKDAT